MHFHYEDHSLREQQFWAFLRKELVWDSSRRTKISVVEPHPESQRMSKKMDRIFLQRELAKDS